MGNTTKSGPPKWVSFVFAIVLLAIAWFIAPLFLPMYRWIHVDWAGVARQHKLSEQDLRRPYTVRFRYAPRGPADPRPFQLLSMDPAWATTGDTHEDEENVAIRINVINDRNGGQPSQFLRGNTNKDRYFTATAWRFPPGSLGFSDESPVILYNSMSLDKLAYGDCIILDDELRDRRKWDQPDDGWTPEGE